MNGAPLMAHARERLRFADRRLLPHDQVNSAPSFEHHDRRVECRVTAPNDNNALSFVVTNLWNLIEDLLRVESLKDGQLSWKMQEPHGNNHLTAQIATARYNRKLCLRL